ncbi:Protein tramtrack, beta isoform [Pseudolycoriella hygida]|uniref:Protein tramtrack, beta isoform n=1 Tax=Pseudolycoriella hygida TaxID=35572 RepID=A0A9Q0N052_9DIPT|nr:Protein tramtrack, beta isoform [Pseudolycoriella hygida]
MSKKQLHLSCNNHHSNIQSAFKSLLQKGTFVDVTLAVEGRHLQAHKVVLSASSSYFESLLIANPCQHPIVILQDVRYNDLKSLLDFMYYGEVDVYKEQLPRILKTAKLLEIKALTGGSKPVKPSVDAESSGTDSDDNESTWYRAEYEEPSSLQEQQQHQQICSQLEGFALASNERASEEHSNIEDSAGLNTSEWQMGDAAEQKPVSKNVSFQHNVANPNEVKETFTMEGTPRRKPVVQIIDDQILVPSMPLDVLMEVMNRTLPTYNGHTVSWPQQQQSDSDAADPNYPILASQSSQSNIGGMSSGGTYNAPNERYLPQTIWGKDFSRAQPLYNEGSSSNQWPFQHQRQPQVVNQTESTSETQPQEYSDNDKKFALAAEAVRLGGKSFPEAANMYGLSCSGLMNFYKDRGYTLQPYNCSE